MSKRVNLNDRIEKPITSAITAFTTHVDTENEYKSDIDTEIITKNVTNNVNKDVVKSGNNSVVKNETIITQIKSIKVGKSVFKSTYKHDDKAKRAAYFLREDTINKIEKCSKLSTLKKAEFVDLILNNILTDILNKIEK